MPQSIPDIPQPHRLWMSLGSVVGVITCLWIMVMIFSIFTHNRSLLFLSLAGIGYGGIILLFYGFIQYKTS